MTKVFLIGLVCCTYFDACLAQTFRFNDTTASVGSQMIWKQIYSPNCQIEEQHLPLIDSLAQFLLRNDKVVVVVAFHGDTYDSNELEQRRGEICGGKRMSAIMNRKYPMINPKRIVYKFPGNSRPLVTQEMINGMQSDAEKLKASAANRRTVVEIIKTDFTDR